MEVQELYQVLHKADFFDSFNVGSWSAYDKYFLVYYDVRGLLSEAVKRVIEKLKVTPHPIHNGNYSLLPARRQNAWFVMHVLAPMCLEEEGSAQKVLAELCEAVDECGRRIMDDRDSYTYSKENVEKNVFDVRTRIYQYSTYLKSDDASCDVETYGKLLREYSKKPQVCAKTLNKFQFSDFSINLTRLTVFYLKHGLISHELYMEILADIEVMTDLSPFCDEVSYCPHPHCYCQMEEDCYLNVDDTMVNSMKFRVDHPGLENFIEVRYIASLIVTRNPIEYFLKCMMSDNPKVFDEITFDREFYSKYMKSYIEWLVKEVTGKEFCTCPLLY